MKSTNTTRTLTISSVLALIASVVLMSATVAGAAVALQVLDTGTEYQNNAASATTSGVTYSSTGVSVPETGSYQSTAFSLSESPDSLDYSVATLNSSSVTIEVYNGSGSLIASKQATATGTGSIDLSTSSATSVYVVVSVADDGDSTTGETAVVDYTNFVAANDKPTADFVEGDNASTVETGVSTTLDASASTDPDSGDTLSYKWDLDGDGKFDDATGATVSVAESSSGTYNYSVKVLDGSGGTNTATYTLDVVESVSGGTSGGSSLPINATTVIVGILVLAGGYLLTKEF